MTPEIRAQLSLMNAFGMARVSTSEQEEKGYSLDEQQRLFREEAKKRGLNLVKLFAFSESATKSEDRTQFRAAIQQVHDADIKHLLVEDTSRFTRDTTDLGLAKDLVFKRDVTIYFLREGYVLSADNENYTLFAILAVMAEKQMRDLSKKVKANLAAKVREGGYPMRAPLGYRIIDGQLQVSQAEADLVQRIFNLYNTDLTSLISISQTLQAENALPPRGLKAWHKQTLDKILQNPVYVGKIRWKGKIYPGKHEPIISERLFNSVQAKIASRSGTRVSRKFNLSGLLRLSDSRRLLTGETAKQHVYYGAHVERDKKRLYLREDRVMLEIKSELSRFAWSESFTAAIIEIARDIVRSERTEVEAGITQAQRALSELRGKQSRLLDVLLAGQITSELYAEKNTEIILQIAERERNLRSLKANDQQFIAAMADIAEKLHRLPVIYRDAKPEDGARILHELLETVLVRPDKSIELQFKEPFRRFALPEKVLSMTTMRPLVAQFRTEFLAA